jgi:multiple sugar transport system substrate-binding protein
MPDMTSLLFTFGGKIFDDDQNPTKVLVRSPEAEEMCRFVRRFVATKAVISRAETTTASNVGFVTLFLRGLNAARIHGLWTRPGQYGTPAGFDWDVAPFPAGPHGRRVTANGAYMLGISPHSNNVAAARRFLRFYLTPRGIEINDRTGDFMPLFREMRNWPGIVPPPDPRHRQYYFDTMEKGMCCFPVHGPGVAELRGIIDSRLDQVSAEPDTPIPVILQTLEDEIYRWLAREKEDGFYR